MKQTPATAESILLVDDQQSNLQVLFQTLKGLGCNLLVAKGGETAVAIAQKKLPDLILLDIMMPEVDGFEVCQRLKGNPATEKIPIIFLSALDDTADKVRGLELGAVDYIVKPFQPEEVIARVLIHLTIHRLSREVRRQKDQLQHELQVVSQLQRDLLPESLPRVPGLKLAVHYETSQYAGGDYYDLAELPEGRLGVLMADAEGHSAPATVLMAMTCALFRSYPASGDEPGQMLSHINENLLKVNRESFVTAIHGVYDSASRILRLARAGHPFPILFRHSENKCLELSCAGVFAMGLRPFPQVPVTEVQLDPGDRVLFFTDGVTERFNEQDELYGVGRLLRSLEAAASLTPEAAIEKIIESLGQFAGKRPADDDQALLLMAVEASEA